jgi:hypothetical protein
MSQEEKSVFWEVIVLATVSKKAYMYMYPIPNGLRDTAIHCTNEQHAMSSHELQSALILTVEFSKTHYTR